MSSLIKIKRSAVQDKQPNTSILELGELALNTFDGKLFFKKDDGAESIVTLLEVTEDNLAIDSSGLTNSGSTNLSGVLSDLDATITAGGITYSISAETGTGGANLRLTDSGSGTDDVLFVGGTNVSVVRTDANTITISSTDTDTTYSAGTGLTLNGTTFDHTNSITAGTASEGGATRTLSYGGTFNIPSVTYDAQGHITATGSITLTLPSADDTNTTYDLTVPTSTTAIRLAGSDATNDDVTITGGTNVTVTRTSATELTIASTDTDTTYSAGNGISLSGTTFSVAAGTGLTQDASGLSHTAHTGDVTGSTALTIANDAVTYAKLQNVSANNVFLGNDNGAGSAVQELTATEARAILNVEDGATADQTASEILTALLTVDGSTSLLDADLLDGQEGTHYLDAANFTGTLPNDFVTLGTMTTGNYVATIAGTANEIEVTGSGSETAAVTIGLPNDVTIGNNLTVTGNLTVSGTTTTVNTETINLADNIITLNSNEAGTPSQNAGIEVERGTSTNVVLQWNEANDYWEIATGGTVGRILTTGDEGTGNGLDADTVDGIEASALTQSGDSVALTGDVTGSTTVAADGSISIATTIAANSVALGTDTTGNYVATIAGTANEIEVTGSGSETAAVTIGLPNDVTIGNNLTVTGNIAIGTTNVFEDSQTTLTTVTQTQIASFNATTYSSGKFVIQAKDSVTGEVHVTEILVVHDGTNVATTEYATMYTGASPLATYDVDINTGNIRILATSASTNSTDYKVTENLITA